MNPFYLTMIFSINNFHPTGNLSQICSVAVKRHHDQGNLYKKAFNLGFAQGFRELVHGHHGRGRGREHGSRQAGLVLN